MGCLCAIFYNCTRNVDGMYSHNEFLISSKFADVETCTLSNPDTLVTFLSEMPIELMCVDSCLFVTFAKQDTLVRAYSLNSNDCLGVVAVRGNGPQELLSPYIVRNAYLPNSDIARLHDTNGHCIVEINVNTRKITKRDLPFDELNGSSMNFDGTQYVYQPIYDSTHFFTIDNKSTSKPIYIDYPFELSSKVEDIIKGNAAYMLSANINTNFSKDRIIASMYFTDIYYVYDLRGNILSKLSLSNEDCDINKLLNDYIGLRKNGIARYSPGYATDSLCYLRRIIEKPNYDHDGYDKIHTSILIVDWDGKPVRLLHAPENIGNFCVDQHGRIIGIEIESTDSKEAYHLVRFSNPHSFTK